MSTESLVGGQSARRRSGVGRLLRWIVAVAALAFVVWSVPVVTKCHDPESASSVTFTVSRQGRECVAHPAARDIALPPDVCARLRCEPGLLESLSRARTGPLLLSLFIYAVATLFWAIRWRMLLRLARVDLTLLSVWRILTEAQAGGLLLPGGVGGDVFRVASIVETGASLAIALSSTLIERMLGLATLATVAVMCAGLFEHAFFDPLTLVLASIPAGFTLGVILVRRPAIALALQRGRLRRFTEKPLAYICEPDAPRVLLASVLPSLVSSALQMALVRCLLYAFGAVPVHESGVYLGASMALIASAIPALPGGIGTGDAAFVFFLGRAGVRPSAALAVCLALRLILYSHAFVGALLSIMRTRTTANRSAPRP